METNGFVTNMIKPRQTQQWFCNPTIIQTVNSEMVLQQKWLNITEGIVESNGSAHRSIEHSSNKNKK